MRNIICFVDNDRHDQIVFNVDKLQHQHSCQNRCCAFLLNTASLITPSPFDLSIIHLIQTSINLTSLLQLIAHIYHPHPISSHPTQPRLAEPCIADPPVSLARTNGAGGRTVAPQLQPVSRGGRTVSRALEGL